MELIYHFPEVVVLDIEMASSASNLLIGSQQEGLQGESSVLSGNIGGRNDGNG